MPARCPAGRGSAYAPFGLPRTRSPPPAQSAARSATGIVQASVAIPLEQRTLDFHWEIQTERQVPAPCVEIEPLPGDLRRRSCELLRAMMQALLTWIVIFAFVFAWEVLQEGSTAGAWSSVVGSWGEPVSLFVLLFAIVMTFLAYRFLDSREDRKDGPPRRQG